MKRIFISYLAVLITSCNSSEKRVEEIPRDKFKDSLVNVIESKRSLIKETSYPIDSTLYVDLFSDYRRLTVTYPNDSVSEKLLQQCALMNFYQGNYDDFMFSMERYDNEYSQFEGYGKLAFLKTFIVFKRTGDSVAYEQSKNALIREYAGLERLIRKVESEN